MKASAVFVLLTIFGTSALAMTQGLALNGGIFQHNMMTLTRNETGKSDPFGDTYFPIGLQYAFPIFEGWNFAPALHATHLTTLLIPKETPDGGAKKNFILLNLPLVTSLTESIDGKMGMGIFRYEIKGEGGTIQLNNGTGTSTFYRPSETKTSNIGHFILGAAFAMTDWQIDTDLLVHSPFSNERRNYSLHLYATYPLTSNGF